MDYDKTCQILLLGDMAVGKTCLINRYTNGVFKEEYISTVGFDYYTKQEEINNKTVQVKLWDTAGQERFKTLTPSFLRNAEGVIIVFDVTSQDSFDNVKGWINSIKSNLGEKIIPIIIVGNKIDMENMREISKEDGKKIASENDFKYFETSAKTGIGVDEAIKEIVNQILDIQDKNEDEKVDERPSFKIKKDNNKDNQKKKGCC
jgi:Ras-related protein Rab-1A